MRRRSTLRCLAAFVLALHLFGVWVSRAKFSLVSVPPVPPAPSQGPSPEAWREFRAKLVSQEFNLANDVDHGAKTKAGGSGADASTSGGGSRVSLANQELLRTQNEELWEEYINGAWAHESLVEVGGLMCRMPLCIELVQQMRAGRADGVASDMRKKLISELADVERGVGAGSRGGDSSDELFERWSKNTNYCYRLAESVVMPILDQLMGKLEEETLDLRTVNQQERELLVMWAHQQEAWQSVCLVLETPPGSTTEANKAVALNRPCGIDPSEVSFGMARQILNGASDSSGSKSFSEAVVRGWREAFLTTERLCLYRGGNLGLYEPATLLHGFGELPGSTEIAEGTRIYTGGIEAAIDGVLAGKYKPMDFKWFLGHHASLQTEGGAWLPVASARSVILKQCLGLPKPLWHEVLEMCGGEPFLISRLEAVKRSDIDEDEGRLGATAGDED